MKFITARHPRTLPIGLDRNLARTRVSQRLGRVTTAREARVRRSYPQGRGLTSPTRKLLSLFLLPLTRTAEPRAGALSFPIFSGESVCTRSRLCSCSASKTVSTSRPHAYMYSEFPAGRRLYFLACAPTKDAFSRGHRGVGWVEHFFEGFG